VKWSDLEPGEIPGPGVWELTDPEYFDLGGHLSSTGVRELLACPAKFRWNQLNARPPKRAFDVGHAAHQLVLGAGPGLVYIDADEWRSKAVKDEVAAVREAGGVPLRPADWHAVHDMAAAIQKHPVAPKLLTHGVPERALLWTDPATGVPCRAKPDWMRPDGLVDLKTTDRADPEHLRKAVWNFGYYLQAAWYLRGFRLLNPDAEVQREPFFVFVAVEKDPPYLITVFQLSEAALAYGDRRCAEALQTYARCADADDWPGYSTDIEDIDLPAWIRTEDR
jgi:hypothetical protein